MSKVDIDLFKEDDIYSLSMFILYKLIGIPEFSVVSELPYVLDKKSLLNLCTYFGGRTIKIPTVSELNSLMHLILLYQYVNIDGIPYEEAVLKAGFKPSELRKIKPIYIELCNILSNYQFGENKHA